VYVLSTGKLKKLFFRELDNLSTPNKKILKIGQQNKVFCRNKHYFMVNNLTLL